MDKEMNFYELNRTIDEIIENGFIINEETGEVLFEAPDLDNLQGQLDEKINYLVGKYKNLDATAEATKKQADSFSERAKRYKSKADSIKKFLNYYANSKGLTKTQIYTNGEISFKKSTSTNIIDEKQFLSWIDENPQFKNKYLEEAEPKILKKALSKDLKEDSDLVIPGVEIINAINIQIK